MGDSLGQTTEILNALVGSSLEAFRGAPYKFKVKIFKLTSRASGISRLPVVLSQRYEGPVKIWVTLSMDLPAALSIADRALKASGSYAMGFSENEQRILKDCYRKIGENFLGRIQGLCGGLEPSGLRLSFGQRIATAPRTWRKPLLVELGIPRSIIELDLAVGLGAARSFKPASDNSKRITNVESMS